MENKKTETRDQRQLVFLFLASSTDVCACMSAWFCGSLPVPLVTSQLQQTHFWWRWCSPAPASTRDYL